MSGLLAACAPPQPDAATDATPSASALTVEAVAPRTENWPRMVQASGPLAAWQEVIVAPETGGLALVELNVDVGAKVTRGQVLARLSSQSLEVEQRKQVALVAQARANLEQARSDQKRARGVERSGALSEQKIEEYRILVDSSQAALDSAQADLDGVRLKLAQTQVVAVDDGVVVSKSAVLGDVVNAGAVLFRLVRQGRVEWRPELDARQLAGLVPGQLARITLPTGETVQGAVRLVEPTLSTGTGRAVLYVSLPVDGPGNPGMFAEGHIELGETQALTLPSDAVVLRDGRAYVYRIRDDGTVGSQPVKIGRRRGDRVEIVADLDAGARIVAGGGAFLSEGMRVTVATTLAAAADANANSSINRE